MVLIEDQYGNVRSNDTLVVTATRSVGAGTLQGITNVTAVGGVASFSNLAHTYATNITIAFTSGSLSSVESGSITVSPAAYNQLLVLLPGETASPTTSIGRSGNAVPQTAGIAVVMEIMAVDAYWNRVDTVTNLVGLTCSDATAVLSTNALVQGTHSFGVTFRKSGSHTVTANDLIDAHTSGTSSAVTVAAGAFAKLQVLLPGETAAAGTLAGKSGTPAAQTAGTPYNVTVNGVDANWNVLSTNDTVSITSSDLNVGVPANAALAGGTASFSVTNRTAGSWTITASNVTHPGIAADTSSAVSVTAGAFAKLQLLVPGEAAAPGTISGKTGTAMAQMAGAAYSVTVNAVDTNWNLVNNGDNIAITSSDANAILPANAALVGGSISLSMLNRTAGNWTVTAADTTNPGIAADTSPLISVTAGGFVKLQLLLPGETAAAGTATGKTGTPSAQTAGTAFNVTVNAVDANWNLVSSVTDTVRISSTDPNAGLPGDVGLVAGTQTRSVTLKTAGSATLTASDLTDGNKAANTSPSTTVSAGAFTKLQVLLPGETGAPGTTNGKTGSPTAQTAGVSYSVTVNAVDADWNLVGTNDTVAITSSDPHASLPGNAALIDGSKTFSVTNRTAGSWTVTASDVTHPSVTSDTSPSFTVNAGLFAKLQVLVPGETAAPGTPTGKTGAPVIQNTDSPFALRVNAVDANWNLINTVSDSIAITSSDANATLPANAPLSGGTQALSVRFNTAGNWTVTAADITNGEKTADTSPTITVNPGAFAKLQLLMPGENAAPGTASGKTGAPTAQTAGNALSVTVRAADNNWNLVSTNDIVHLASSDEQATLPVDAALSAGMVTFTIAFKTSGSQTVTASDLTHTGIASSTGADTAVNPAAASKLAIATQPSATATVGVPFAQQPVILIEDQYGNLRSNDTLVVTATRGAGAGTLLGTTNITAVGGVATFTDLVHAVATNITIQFTSGALTAATSGTIAVNAGTSPSRLLVLLPGETAAPGTPTGKAGIPTAQTAGSSFTVRVSAVDLYWNVVNTVTDLVSITSSDPTAVLPTSAALIGGANSFDVTFKIAGTQTVTASDISGGITPAVSAGLTVNPGALTKLQLLAPGESAAPGTLTGKTGAPTDQIVGTAFSVTVNAVDANWNVVDANDTVQITSSDASAIMPANAALAGGTSSLSVTFETPGSFTVTASNATHPAIAASTSPPISVGHVATILQAKPIVAIHDSELTRALEALPAVSPTPSGAGTTGFEWWPTNWHYFVMPESVKETLRSDGTVYEVVSDEDISAGRLLAANGQPRCPIVISLASEAIRDDEIAQLTNYVAAGGTLLVGSSAFTRNTDGTTRGDFALANQMGVHMVNSRLQNWANNATFTKTLGHRLVSHIPSGVLAWQMPSAADEVPWGTSPAHALAGPHSVWQVQLSDAVVIAQGDVYPYLSVKQYGKGSFIYCAAMQPLMGHGGLAPGMYAYGILRNAIETAFAASKLPVPKLSPWPYAYDAALNVRHDLENFQPLISAIESSAQYEATNGVKGDYYFCTGTLRAEMTNSATIIAGLRRAVSDYGATIGSHNGGLKNPNNPSLVVSNYDYWHWGPDEALDVIPSGYVNGKAYAFNSMSNSFLDIEGWLSGLTNGIRSWVGCYFNSIREDSYDLQEQLGVKTAGEQKLGPFPHWTVSTRTAGKRYAFVTLPLSDWFVGSQVAQAMESGHTVSSIHAAVDSYYGLGGLVNLYSHSLSDGSGQAGALLQEYIRYSVAKPRIWSTNALGIYSWWTQRSKAQIIPNYTTSGNQAIVTLSVVGASDPRMAVEVVVPQPSFYGLQVFTNGASASGSAYRSSGQVVKLLVGTSVTNAEIRYTLEPVAQNDVYNVAQDTPLVVPAPGVLNNDLAGVGGNLLAALLTGPTHGTLSLNTDGGFSYLPATNFTGVDAFGYQASDGGTNFGAATVTMLVTPTGDLFFDDFTRSANADPLAPWQVTLGTWTITNGVLQGYSSPQSYGYAYVSNNWGDYCVQGSVRFPAGAFGGGLGGRVNPVTGAHYAAWIYPEGSAGGSSVLKLIKFQNWASFGYNNSSYTPMQTVSLAGVGTNWHTLKLAFHNSRVAVYFDGNQVMSVADIEPQPFLSGGISVDMWTDSASYLMSADNLIVSPLAVADSYSVYENTTLTVPLPGVLGNDTAVYGTNLLAVVVTGPTNGTLNLSSNGGFSYSPTANFAGADSFVYQIKDGQTNLGAATVTITVSPALIVTADNQSRSYGANNPVLTGSIMGVHNGDDITAIYTTSADTNSSVGTYPITVTFLDPDNKLGNYHVITNNGSLTVTAAGLTVIANDASRVYGALNPPFTATLSGIQNGDNITATYATPATEVSPVGSYAITPTLVDPSGKLGNYTVTSTNGTLSVTAAGLTVVANNASRVYGTTNPVFSGTITGIQNGDNITATYATPATEVSPVGSYAITPTLVDPSGKLGNYTVASTNGTLSVTAAGLTVVANNASRVYGATNPVFSGTITGIQNGDNITATYATAATEVSPVGSYPITPTLVDPNGKLGNYTVASTNGTLNVTAAGLTVVANNASRVYGATNPVFSGTITGIQNGDNITATYATPATEASPVGSYAITPTLVDPNGKLGNYTVASTNGTLSVAAAGLTVVANNASRVYGATNPVFSGTITGIQNGDNITATYATPATEASPVGSYAITPTLVDPNGKLGNYTVASTNGALSVTAAGLTVVANNASRVYGATNPVFSGTITGIQNGDNITATYASTATEVSPVGSYPITPTLVDPNGKLVNYTVASTNGTLSVTAAGLTVVANNASRVYGATNPVFSGTITGIQNGDNITATYATPATEVSPVGSYAITPTLVDPSGKLGNYTVASTNGTLSVTAAGLTVVANNASRVYGATNPVFSGTITGIQNGDNITATYATTATEVSPVGSYPITPTLVDPSGKLGNYTVASTNGTLSVTAAGLTVVANNASRVYGATNPVFSGTITGIQNGDNITATYATPATEVSPVGSYAITPTLVDPSGKLGNYTVASTNGTLSVTAAGLTVVANNASRVYGATNPVFSGTITGIQNGDNITATYATTATEVSPVGSYPITPTLVDPNGKLGNYTVASTNGTLSVTAAGLTVVANNASRVYGATNPVFSGTITGIQNGDNITATYATTATEVSPVGSYPITPTLVDPSGKLGNYTVASTNGTLSVTAAGLTVVANNASRVYGATNPVFSGTITGIQNGDNITATYATTATEVSPVGSYPITPTLVDPSGKLGNYTVASTNGMLTINPAALIVTADPKYKTYGQQDPILTYQITGGRLVNGDGLSGSLSRATGENAGTYAIQQGTLVATTNYALTYMGADLLIWPAWLVAQPDHLSRLYGATNPVLTISYIGFMGTDGVTNLTEEPQASTLAQPSSPVGDYEITLTGGSATNYTLILDSGLLTVTPVALTVVANNASRVYGATNPVFSGTITGIQNGDNITATYATTATEVSPVGSYAITPTLVDPSGKLANYTVASTNGTLSVTAAGLTVVANNASRVYGATNPVFSGTITGLQNGDNITATYATTATVRARWAAMRLRRPWWIRAASLAITPSPAPTARSVLRRPV